MVILLVWRTVDHRRATLNAESFIEYTIRRHEFNTKMLSRDV